MEGWPFVGRDAELASLASALSDATQGQLVVAVVEGEPGIGKSRLLAEALDRRRDFRVLSGRPTQMDSERPFAAMADAFGSRVALSGHDPGALHREVDAAVDALEAAALVGPVALVVDDVQWVDPASALVLRAMTRRLVGVPVAMLLACRPTASAYHIIDSIGAPDQRRLVLSPLEVDDVDELVRQRLGAIPDPHLSAQVTKAAGNPLFVTELLHALVEDGTIEIRDDRATLRDAALPVSFTTTVLRRLAALPSATIELLRVASILGETFRIEDLALATDQSVVDVMPKLRPALDAGVVGAGGDSLRFRHDLIRDAIYNDLPRALRDGLHVELARKQAAAGAPAERVATHFALGARAGDEEAVHWLRRAASETATPEIATRFLDHALAVGGPRHADRLAMRLDLADHLLLAGRARDAEATVRAVLDDGCGAAEGRARLVLAQALFTQGRWADEIAAIDLALARPLDAVTLARLRAERALARMWVGDVDGSARDSRQAADEGRRLGDDVAESTALGHLAASVGMGGQLAAAVEIARQGLDAARTPAARARQPHLPVYITLVIAGEFDAAADVLRAGLRVAEETGGMWVLPVYHTVAAMAATDTGDWDTAVTNAEAGLGLGDEIGTHPVTFAAHCVLATIAVHRSELEVAEQQLAQARGVLSAGGRQWATAWHVRAEALMLEATGSAPEALASLQAFWATSDQGADRDAQIRVATDLVRLAAQIDPAAAAAVANTMDPLVPIAGAPRVAAAAQLARGVAERHSDVCGEAAIAYRSIGRLPEAADAFECGGRIAGDATVAASFYRDALAGYEALAAKTDLNRVVATMRSVGIRRGSRAPRKRGEIGWDSLTPTELDVIRLAARGLTNPEIGAHLYMSRHTVATHLSHIFSKLGITSRVELAAEAARRRMGMSD